MVRRVYCYLKITLIAFSLLCLPGCWDYHRINDRAQILAIGIDPAENQKGQYLYTLQVPEFSGGGSGGGGQSGPSQTQSTKGQYKNDSVIASSIAQAISIAQTWSDKQFFLGNLQVIIINRKLSGKTVQALVDELMRNQTVDRLAFVIETDASAKQVLQAEDSLAPADLIDRALGPSIKQHGYIPRTRLWEFWRDLNSIGLDPACPLVRVTEQGVQFTGLVAFRDATPVLDIRLPESLGYQLIVSRVHQMLVEVPDGTNKLSVGNLDVNSQHRVTFENGRTRLHIHVRAKADIVHSSLHANDPISEPEINRYESLLSQYLTTLVKTVVGQLQGQGADTIGFGRQVVMKNPRNLNTIEHKWPTIFKNASLDVQVKVVLKRKGTLM